MKKKQVALLLAALMCITSVAESAAVMGAEFSSGEETVEMQGTEEEAEAEDTAEIWTSGEEVSDFGTDEAPEVDGFTSEESEASTDAAGAKQVKGSFEVAYITEEQYNNALQNEERPEVDMKTVEDTTFSSALNSIEGENTGYCFVSVQDLEDAADFVAPEGMTVLVENARARSITPNGNIAFWGMIDPPETIEIKEGKGTTAFFCQDMRSVLKGTGSDDKVIFCGQNNAIGGISGVENIYLRNNSHDLQVSGLSMARTQETGFLNTLLPKTIVIKVKDSIEEEQKVLAEKVAKANGTTVEETFSIEGTDDFSSLKLKQEAVFSIRKPKDSKNKRYHIYYVDGQDVYQIPTEQSKSRIRFTTEKLGSYVLVSTNQRSIQEADDIAEVNTIALNGKNYILRYVLLPCLLLALLVCLFLTLLVYRRRHPNLRLKKPWKKARAEKSQYKKDEDDMQ